MRLADRVSLLAATGEGVVRLDGAGGGWTATPLLDGVAAMRVAAGADGRTVLAASMSDGVRVSDDGGETWRGVALPERAASAVAVGADGTLLAGTEPSRLFVSRDGGAAWRELDALQRIPSRPRWSFPPRPWTHHVSAIAPDPFDPSRLLVGIELGGLMLSTDGGETFSDHRAGAQPDVHSLAWHPREAGRAYEAGGGGAAWSSDAGETWVAADAGRDRDYTWALAADGEDPDVWFVSATHGPGDAHGGGPARARIYRWRGDRFQAISDELDSLPTALVRVDGALLAGLRDGTLLVGDGEGGWERAPAALPRIVSLAAVPAR